MILEITEYNDNLEVIEEQTVFEISDFDFNVLDASPGTIDDTVSVTGLTTKISDLFNQFAAQLKFITGQTHWYTQNVNFIRILDTVTRTVNAIGGDYATISTAITDLKKYRLNGACVVDVAAGSYTENLNFTDLTIPGTLLVRGDTRVIAGFGYVHGLVVSSAIANAGVGTITLSRSGAGNIDLTVACSTTNPDFNAAGVVPGDIVLVWDGVTLVERIVGTVTTNVIRATGTWPAVVTGYTIYICPNRIINASAAISINFDNDNISLQGFYVKSSTASAYGLYVNTARKINSYNNLISMTGATSNGVGIAGNGYLNCNAANGIFAAVGYNLLNGARLIADYTKISCNGAANTVGIYARNNTMVSAIGLQAVDNPAAAPAGSIGLYASGMTYIDGQATGSKILGFNATANPTAGSDGNRNSYIYSS
jgi:hypothetical protein